MPILSRSSNCVLCASPHHDKSLCPRNGGGPALQPTVPKAAAAKPKSDAANARAAAKRAANIAKSDSAKARAAAKRAAAIAKFDAAKARATAKRAAARAIIIATKARETQQDAWHDAVYAALSALAPVPKTAGSYKHSRWAVVADVCVRCARPRLGCMCLF